MSKVTLSADPASLDTEFSFTNLPKFIKRTNDGEGSNEKYQFYIYYKDRNGIRSKKVRINTGECEEEAAKAKEYELLCMFKEDPSMILTYKMKGCSDSANQSCINWLNQPFYLTLTHVFEHNIKIRSLNSTGDYYYAFATIMIPYFKYQHPTLLTKDVDIGVVQQMFDVVSGKKCPNTEACYNCSYRKGENKLPCENAEHLCMKRIMFDKERELNKNGQPSRSKYNVATGDSLKHFKTYLNMTFKYVSERVLSKDSDMMLFKNHVNDIKEHLRIEAVSKPRACLEPLDVEKLRGLFLSDIMTENVEDSKFELVALYLCLAFGLRIGEAASVKLSNIHLTEDYKRLDNYISIEGTRKDTKRDGLNARPHLKGISSNHVIIDIKNEMQAGIKKLHKRKAYVIDEKIYNELKLLLAYKKRIELEMCVDVEEVNPDGYCCVYNDGSVLARVDSLSKLFKEFLKVHNIHVFDKENNACQDDQFVPHSLRHSFITGLEMFDNHGFTAAAIRKMTAHSPKSDAHEVYIHQLTVGVTYGAERDQLMLQRIESEFGRTNKVQTDVAEMAGVKDSEDVKSVLLKELLSRYSETELLNMLIASGGIEGLK